jgi:hypothetical protein
MASDYDRSRLTQVRQQLWNAMSDRSKVWISYNGGSVPLVPRCITPVVFGVTSPSKSTTSSGANTKHKLFRAVCHNENTIKSFNVMKVLEVRAEPWVLGAAAVPSSASNASRRKHKASRKSTSTANDLDDDDDYDDDDNDDDEFIDDSGSKYTGIGDEQEEDEDGQQQQQPQQQQPLTSWQALISILDSTGTPQAEHHTHVINNYLAPKQYTPSTSSTTSRSTRRTRDPSAAATVLASSVIAISSLFSSVEQQVMQKVVSTHGAQVVALADLSKHNASKYLVLPKIYIDQINSESHFTSTDASAELITAADQYTQASRTGQCHRLC